MTGNTDDVEGFFNEYPPSVAELARDLRAFVRTEIPDAREELDSAGKVVGYSFGPGYNGLLCTIIPSKTGVKLGLVGGAELANPRGLLEGSGKRHRYVAFAKPADLERSGLRELIHSAVEAWRRRLKKTHRGKAASEPL